MSESERRHEWHDAIKNPPKAMIDVLLYNGDSVFMGWNESTEPGEDPCYVTYYEVDFYETREVTHWMPLPESPK